MSYSFHWCGETKHRRLRDVPSWAPQPHLLVNESEWGFSRTQNPTYLHESGLHIWIALKIADCFFQKPPAEQFSSLSLICTVLQNNVLWRETPKVRWSDMYSFASMIAIYCILFICPLCGLMLWTPCRKSPANIRFHSVCHCRFIFTVHLLTPSIFNFCPAKIECLIFTEAVCFFFVFQPICREDVFICEDEAAHLPLSEFDERAEGDSPQSAFIAHFCASVSSRRNALISTDSTELFV